MPRTQRGVIDMLANYTVLDANLADPVQEDYWYDGKLTTWGIGLITFGAPTQAQKDWIADPANYADLSSFPTDWVSFGFPSDRGAIEILQGSTWIEGVLITAEGIKGAVAYSIGGFTGSGNFHFSESNVLTGSALGEALYGSDAAETLEGFGGNDVLFGGAGADALRGGAGNDYLSGGSGPDRLWGGDGDDILEPGSDETQYVQYYLDPAQNLAGVYFVDGGAGHDRLVLDYSASDSSQSLSGDLILSSDQVIDVEALQITGSAFNDVLSGSTSGDLLFGGGGFDVLDGGAGNDWLDAGAPDAGGVGDLDRAGYTKATATSLDHLFKSGTYGPTVDLSFYEPEYMVRNWDLLPTGPKIYSFTVDAAGREGRFSFDFPYYANYFIDFHITDEEGTVDISWPFVEDNTFVFPHAGTYYLEVDFGNYNVWDNATLNVSLTIEGAEILAANRLIGGAGNDTFVIYAASDEVIEFEGEGSDTVRTSVDYVLPDHVENLVLTNAAGATLTGNGLDNSITGGLGNDALYGLAGRDKLEGGAGDDLLDGGAGGDTADYSNATAAVSVWLTRQDAPQDTQGAGFDTLVSIENLNGSAYDDTLSGNRADNKLVGRGGADFLDGRSGDDILMGGSGDDFMRGQLGNDRLEGGDGHDVLRGDFGDDVMLGGAGDDIYFVETINDVVIEYAGEGADEVRLYGTDWTVAANIETVRVMTGSGTVAGNGEANTLFGSSNENTLFGKGGADYLDGGGARDILDGGSGDDILIGGAGQDTMTGGSGADRFVFRSTTESAKGTANADIITDFSRAQGDRISLTQIDAIEGTGANDSFAFVGTAAFSGTAGELRYGFSGGNTLIQMDTDGDGQADSSIVLTGQIALQASDFLGVASGAMSESGGLPTSATAQADLMTADILF